MDLGQWVCHQWVPVLEALLPAKASFLDDSPLMDQVVTVDRCLMDLRATEDGCFRNTAMA